MSREVTFRGKLVAKRIDLMGYLTYVFQDLEEDAKEKKYIMCTQFPNWNQEFIALDSIGYVTVRYVRSGIDTWYDGKVHVPYKNTDIHFLKFIPELDKPTDMVLQLDDIDQN